MADRVLRDHSQPCKHKLDSGWDQAYQSDGVWECRAAACPGGREVTMMEGIVTATGNNTMPGHGVPGPWAFVTIYGDFEPFDTMLVTALEV